MTYGGPCHFCGEDVQAEHAAYGVTGWEYTRDQGGANQIHGRVRLPNLIAHQSCAEQAIQQKRAGVIPGQEALL